MLDGRPCVFAAVSFVAHILSHKQGGVLRIPRFLLVCSLDEVYGKAAAPVSPAMMMVR